MNCSFYDAENAVNSNIMKTSYCLYQYDCSYQSNHSSYSQAYHVEDKQPDKQEEYQAYENAYYENNLMSTEKVLKKEKKNKAVSLNKNQSDNTVNINYITEISKLECWTCC